MLRNHLNLLGLEHRLQRRLRQLFLRGEFLLLLRCVLSRHGQCGWKNRNGWPERDLWMICDGYPRRDRVRYHDLIIVVRTVQVGREVLMMRIYHLWRSILLLERVVFRRGSCCILVGVWFILGREVVGIVRNCGLRNRGSRWNFSRNHATRIIERVQKYSCESWIQILRPREEETSFSITKFWQLHPFVEIHHLKFQSAVISPPEKKSTISSPVKTPAKPTYCTTPSTQAVPS